MSNESGDIHVMPLFGREHIESPECWCAPKPLPETQDKEKYACVVWVHNLEN